MLAVQLCVHQTCGQEIHIAHHRQYVQKPLTPCKIIQRTLRKMIAVAVTVLGFVKIEVP